MVARLGGVLSRLCGSSPDDGMISSHPFPARVLAKRPDHAQKIFAPALPFGLADAVDGAKDALSAGCLAASSIRVRSG